MTTTLERLPAPVDVRRRSRFAIWVGQWRVALRLARRDAWRAKGRAILVLLIIGLPVTLLSLVDVGTRQEQLSRTPAAQILLQTPAGAEGQVFLNQAGVRQGMFGEIQSSGSGPEPTSEQLLAALPEGSRLIPYPAQAVPLILTVGEWSIPDTVQLADLSEPILAGSWRVTDGRLPQTTAEVALFGNQAERLSASVGDTLVAEGVGDRRGQDVRLTVVGIVESSSPPAYSGVALPGALPAVSDDVSNSQEWWYVDSPSPILWTDVRAVNAVGGVVQSVAVAQDPPVFCTLNQLCLDDSSVPLPDGYLPPEPTAEELAQQAALYTVVTVLVVLQVALLAGPAFAVQLRRRQRELGLVGASGGDSRVLRRTVLASGVVLGVVASVGGAALAWCAVWLLGSSAKGVFGAGGTLPGPPPVPVEMLGIVAVGIIAAVAAALVPAVTAGRGDVIDALRGRRPVPPVASKRPVLAVVLGLVGLGVMAYGVSRLDPIVLCVGILAAQLGVVMLMPWLVVQTGKLGGRLPLSARMSVRDAGRHRLRTSAAACAIAAAAAGAVGVSAWAGSATYQYRNTDVLTLDGVSVITSQPQWDEAGAALPADPQLAAKLVGAVAAADPGARTALVRALVGTSADPATGAGYVVCDPVGEPTEAQYLDPTYSAPCSGRRPANLDRLANAQVLVVQPADVDLLLGPAAPLDAARDALERGQAVVLQPGGVVDGEVRLLVAGGIDPATGAPVANDYLTVPAIEVLEGALPADVLVGPAFLERPEAAGVVKADDSTASVLATPSAPDERGKPTFADRVQLELYRAQLPASLDQSSFYADPFLTVLLVGTVATAFMALLAGLMLTALALADGRSDIATLAAVGAPPGARRRMAAASAGYVSLLGCVVGAVSGLAAAWVLIPLLRGQTLWVTPWPALLGVVVGVPLVTTAAAYLTTRSKVELVRRLDS